jgi:DNA-binding MurR/RpiR family transcriptional regulator
VRAGDVVIGVSHSGRSSITVEGLTIARDRGALTIGISNYLRSPLRDASRYFFCTSFPETRVKVAALSSRTAQLCVLDALYLLCARHARSIWDVEKVDAQAQSAPVTPGREQSPLGRQARRAKDKETERWNAITCRRSSTTPWTGWI